MAGVTLAQAQELLDAYVAAALALASSQSYTITTSTGSRTLTRANLDEVNKAIATYDAMVKRLSAPTRSRTRYYLPG